MDGVTFVPPSHHFSSSPLSNPTKSRALNKITLLSYDLLVGSFLKSERFIALVVIYFHVNNKKKNCCDSLAKFWNVHENAKMAVTADYKFISFWSV